MLSDYGPLAGIVGLGGCIIAAGGAFGMGWRRRARWEPSEQDIDKGAQKVGALVASVSIALIYALLRTAAYVPALTRTTIWLLAATLLSLLVYSFLISVFTFHQEIVNERGAVEERKIIGGLWLIPGVQETLSKKKITLQAFFKGTAYQKDAVWPRTATALSKLLFVVAYLGLTTCGTVALACGAIIFEVTQK